MPKWRELLNRKDGVTTWGFISEGFYSVIHLHVSNNTKMMGKRITKSISNPQNLPNSESKEVQSI